MIGNNLRVRSLRGSTSVIKDEMGTLDAPCNQFEVEVGWS